MKIIIGAVNILVLLSITFMQWKHERPLMRAVYWPALLFKMGCGIGLGLLYTYYYTIGDTFNYFDDGSKLAALARTDLRAYCSFLWSGDESFAVWSYLNFQQPRALFLSKICSIFNLLTADNYWIISLYFSMMSFIGAWELVKTIVRFSEDLRFVSIVTFLFFPSVVFWSSGLIKESLAMASLFFIVTAFLRLWMRESLALVTWIVLLVALWMLWNLKYYYLAVLLPVLSAELIMRLIVLPRIKFKRRSIRFLIWCGVFIFPLYIATLVHPNFYPERFLQVIVDNYDDFTAISAPEDVIHYASLQANVWSVLQNVPKALISGFFRPFLWEAGNVFQLLVAVENFILLILLVTSFSGWKNIFTSGKSLLVLSVLVYIVLLCVFLALSTPNFGTLTRYRVGFLPFFILLIGANNPVALRLELFIQRSFRKLVQ